ncbi:MAG: cryptochrome/photolyase family protein, partial [Pseudomonadota bacterium]
MSKKKKTSRLVLILGDQLTPEIASLRSADPSTDVVIMGEIVEEATYVQHHKKKLIFVFSAMRHFAENLREAGWSVDYAALDGAKTYTSFKELVADAVDRYAPEILTVVEPGEWRLFEAMKHWDEELDCAVEILDDERFLCSHDEFADWAEGRKSLRMEYFYREMRKKTGLLIEDGAPEGGKWNYDQENRKPPKDGLKSPAPPRFEPDAITRNVIDLVEDRFGDHFGDAAPFWFAVTRKDAEKARDRFLTKALAQFG